MKAIASKLALVLLVPTVALLAQAPKPMPEIKALEVWVGDWTFTGIAKDGPNEKEHPLTWRFHAHWILSGFAVQNDQQWIESGITTKYLEVMHFDPARKSFISTGYGDDGSGWISTMTLKGDTWFDSGKMTLPDGKTASLGGSWTFSPNHLSITATEEMEQDGSKWVLLRVKGTKTQQH
jgi:hypothetical protein